MKPLKPFAKPEKNEKHEENEEAAQVESLWGDLSWINKIEKNYQTSPSEILSEQGKILAKLTDGKIFGFVTHVPGELGRELSFYIKERYSRAGHADTLFKVIKSKTIYPLTINTICFNSIKCENEKEFKETVAKILSSPEVHEVIEALLIQPLT